MTTKAKEKKFNRDDPVRWATWDAWSEACHYAALKGHFNLREDAKVGIAFGKNDLEFIRKTTKKRLAAVGATRPKWKKQKKMGYPAMDEPGTRAYALRLYERKIYGTPKPLPKLKKAKKKSEPKKEKTKQPHKNPVGPPNPDLPQNDAYAKARKKIKKGEILLHLTHRGEDRYTAVYYHKQTKKRRSLHLTGEYTPAKVIGASKKKPKKAVKKSEPKKAKKKSSRY